MRRLAVCCLVGLWALSPAAAQRAKPKVPQPEDILPDSELDDPIGIDAESRSLESAIPKAVKPDAAAEQRERERFGPEPPPLSVRAGEVLTALAAVRETAHRLQVALQPGLLEARVEIELSSLSARPAEVRYRLAVPEHAVLLGLTVCVAAACREGVAGDAGSLAAYAASVLSRSRDARAPKPVAHAQSVRDERGAAILVHAAPVREGQPLRLQLRYRAPAPVFGGMLRATLPARGMDPQAAPTELTLSLAKGLIDARIGRDPAGSRALALEPWSAVELSARASGGGAPSGRSALEPCAGEPCGAAFALAPAGPLVPADVVLALDVSPSTEGPARGRLMSTVATLLSTAPTGSRVRALAFAARASALVPDALEPSQIALAPLQAAIDGAELGSATRFEAVWATAAPWLERRARTKGNKPLIVIVGDGGLTLGAARAFERARAAGVEVSSVNTGDRPTSAALRAAVHKTSGITLDVGAEAGDAAAGRDPTRLGERLAALFARTVAPQVRVVVDGKQRTLGPLRAGDTLTFRAPARSAPGLQIGARSIRSSGAHDAAATLIALDPRDLRAPAASAEWPAPPRSPKHACDRRGPAFRHGGLSTDAAPLLLAEEHTCRPKPAAKVRSGSDVGIGMPADPLLDMLRRRVMPVARGCFRRDRAGRAEYQKRAVFAFTLAEREVIDAHVEGKIPEALRVCLLAAVDTLEVPRFTGLVTVRYPLVTESLPLPEQIELRPATAGNLDALFGHEKPP
jgi:hypothetical protein